MTYWDSLDQLMRDNVLVIDRPRGSAHPRYPGFIYLVDYGYLEGTKSGDGRGIDVWRGTQPDGKVQAILVSVDMIKKDVEIKLIVGCTEEEIKATYTHNNTSSQSSILVKREE